MNFTSATLLLALALGCIWVCSKVLRHFFVKSDLKNLSGPPSKSFLVGNFGQIFCDKNAWQFHQELVEKYGRVIPVHGPFAGKILYVLDPKALYHITSKDSHIYEENFAFVECNRILFGDGILSTLGEIHRKQRKQLNPVFSVSNIREFAPVMYNISRKVRDALRWKVKDGPAEFNILPWVNRAALETIGQTALGYSFDSLEEGGYIHPYSGAVKDLIPMLFHFTFQREYLVPILVKTFSAKFRRFVVDLIPRFFKNACRLRDVIDTMEKTSIEVFEEKKRAVEADDETTKEITGRGKDMMSILIRANLETTEGDRMSDKEVLGHMTGFIFAATDTTTVALAQLLHQLASHQDVQERVRREIMEAQAEHGREELGFEEVMSLPYLDAIVRETLRLYPPVPVVTRETTEDAVLPLSKPITGIDGREMSSIAVPKDTLIFISILMANRDTSLWGPDAREWKPERWLSPLPEQLADARMPGIYSQMMTFMGGARACLGFKFSQLEIKIMLSVLLKSFRFKPAKEEIFWEVGPLLTPNIKGQPGKSQLPMLVELL